MSRVQRPLLVALACALLTVGGRPVYAEDIDLAAVPPFLLEGVPPNLVLTLDNSASMGAGYLPTGPAQENDADRAVFSSSDLNAVYYDPAKTYLPGRNADGLTLGNAVFAAAESFPYLNCEPGATVDLGSAYVVARRLGFDDDCPSGSAYSANAASAAFYHLYDPDNRYNTNPEKSAAVCNAVGRGVPFCNRCGDDFAGPDNDTPDACFDRVLVGGSADLLIAECTNVPSGTAGITAQDVFADRGGAYSDSTGLALTDRIDGRTCQARDDDSALGVDAVDIAKTNFANWYRYHRTRFLVAKTALSRVMQTLSGGVRIAYQGMRRGEMWESESGAFAELANRFDTYSGSKSAFYQWMFNLHTGAEARKWLGTSHVRAGEFIASELAQADNIGARLDGGSAFADNSCGLKCRNNVHLMFTDGGWEDTWGDQRSGSSWPCQEGGNGCWISTNQDGSSVALPDNAFGVDGYDHTAAATQVFADQSIGMLADIVFYYWRTDVDGDDTNNQVPASLGDWDDDADVDSVANFWNPRNDPATWQHLAFYAVGLGMDGAVTPNDESPYGTYRVDGVEKTLLADGFPDDNPSPYAELAGPFNAIRSLDARSSARDADGIPDLAKVDDLYHATINGRGRYYNAYDAQDLISSFADLLDRVSSASAPEASNASVAVSTAQLGDDTLQFQTVVDASRWRGELRAYQVSMGDGQEPCGAKPRGELCQSGTATYWTAPLAMAANDREIITLAAGTPEAFTADNFSALSRAQQLGLLGCGAETDVWSGDKAHCNVGVDLASDYPDQLQLAKDRIDYLRGDAAKETDTADGFRARDGHWLGDSIGSNVQVVTAPGRMFRDADYAAFRNSDAAKNRARMVYVGANDGMLHAFDAADGTERFAYVPEAVYTHLSDLADPDYGESIPKRAFVDGPLASADAKFSNADGNGGWRSVLLGSLGLGAQGVYALDITHPGSVSQETPADLPLWEFTDASGSDADDGALDGRDMGYSLGPPAIVRIDDDLADDAGPTWVALINNGYNNTSQHGEVAGYCTDADLGTNCTVSQTGNAVLYLLRLGGTDGTRIFARIDTGHGFCQDPRASSAPLPTGNGCAADAQGRTNALGPVTPVDVDGDLIADLAYAGDLFGNLWRFDLVDIGGDHNPTLLFSAQDADGMAQPITSAVVAHRHPVGVGVLVLFGTGQYLNAGDKSDLQVQTFYGIWDDGGQVYGRDGDYVAPARGDLLAQNFKAETTVNEGGGSDASSGRSSTDLSIDWSNGQRGWYIDLKLDDDAEGERVVAAPQLRGNRVMFVSIIPDDCCSAGGLSWINALDANDGSRLGYTPFDYNRDGSLDANDRLSALDDTGDTFMVVGSSIRILTDGGTGIYSVPSQLGLGGGELQSIVSDSEGDLIQLRESTAREWRNWVQLQ